jgi:hypothetical protein
MSALPPKADIAERDRNVRFVPQADSCTAAKSVLFDHLVGGRKQRRRNTQTERFRGLEINMSPTDIVDTLKRLKFEDQFRLIEVDAAVRDFLVSAVTAMRRK